MPDTAIDAFKLQADITGKFIELAWELRKKHGVVDVTHAIESRDYLRLDLKSSFLEVSFWSEVKLKDGRVVTLWIDLEPNEGRWLVDGRISWFGSDIIYRAESKAFDSFDEAQAAVRALLDDLSGRVTHIVAQELSQE